MDLDHSLDLEHYVPGAKSGSKYVINLPGFSALPGFNTSFHGDGQSALNLGTTVSFFGVSFGENKHCICSKTELFRHHRSCAEVTIEVQGPACKKSPA